MEPRQPERRLAAILAADVEGYSRLMHADEERTLSTLTAFRKLVTDLIAADHGEVFGSAGDSVLAEFPSVAEAFHCAITMQRALARANADLEADARMLFRIGLNVGDVIVTNGDFFGEGVNIAARIETLAEPGGICVSRGVRDQLRDRVSETFEDLGEHQVKNIARAVRVYRVRFDPLADAEPVAPADRLAAAVEEIVAENAEAGDAEIVFWRSVEASSDDAEYRLYLERYPQGAFADIARARLARGATANDTPDERRVELLFWESVRDSGNRDMIAAYLEKYPAGEFRPLAKILLAGLAGKA
jgi:class 3 adenylate cyclase